VDDLATPYSGPYPKCVWSPYSLIRGGEKIHITCGTSPARRPMPIAPSHRISHNSRRTIAVPPRAAHDTPHVYRRCHSR
jgi:hypothetical protein